MLRANRLAASAPSIALIVMLFGHAALAQGEEFLVELISDGEEQSVSPDVVRSIVAGVELILETCNLSSAHPVGRIDWPEGEVRVARWRERSCGDRLLIRYAQTKEFATIAGPVRVDEILLPFPRGQDIPGLPLSRDSGGVTLYGFCSGPATVELACTAGVEEHMPATYQAYCRDFREIQRSVFYRSLPEEPCD